MENNKKQVGGGSSSSSSPVNFDHLFGPKDSASSFFESIFPPSSTVGGRDSRKQDVGLCKNYGSAAGTKKWESKYGGISNQNTGIGTNNYQNETVEPSYYSSSIYYGGQENYSPRTTEHHYIFRKGTADDDPNGNNSNSTSRGNWWQGSLYY